MAQFDVHRLSPGGGLVLDCQSDLLQQLNTRFVVPLIPEEDAPQPARRLNPTFVIDGESFVMVTQFAAAVHSNELGEAVASVRDQSFEVIGALDVLISGV
jgi:toxin CcdB